jgi:hypothetical protein
MRRFGGALALAALVTIFAAGCVVRERDGYDGNYGYGRDDRRDEGRYEHRDDRRDDDRRGDDRRDGERRY